MHFYFEIQVTLCFEIQKNNMNNIINISENSLQVALFKQAKPGAYEDVAILSLQTNNFLTLVYILYFILYFIWLIPCRGRMFGVGIFILSHKMLNENSVLVPKHLQANSCPVDMFPAGMLLLWNKSKLDFDSYVPSSNGVVIDGKPETWDINS